MGLDDHARALTMDGRDAAARLAERLQGMGLHPDVAFVSSANRTMQTFKRMATVWGEFPFHIEEDLYWSAGEQYLSVLARVGDADTVLMVGHEPTTSHVAAWLSGDGSLEEALQRVMHGMPTAAAAVLELDIPWDEIGEDRKSVV